MGFKFYIVLILLMLPDINMALPVHRPGVKGYSSDALRSLLSSIDTKLLTDKLERNGLRHGNPSNIGSVQLKSSVFPGNRQKTNSVKPSLWSGKLLAMTLYDKSRKSHAEAVHKKALADYDPLGGGVWGKKKRSIEEYSDFDYEADDL